MKNTNKRRVSNNNCKVNVIRIMKASLSIMIRYIRENKNNSVFKY